MISAGRCSKEAVHRVLTRITQRLDSLKIPYAIVGIMTLFFHGYRRFNPP